MIFNEDQFRRDISSSLDHAKKVLSNLKNPQLASSVNHQYSDKYNLVEFLAKVSLASTFNSLNVLGR